MSGYPSARRHDLAESLNDDSLFTAPCADLTALWPSVRIRTQIARFGSQFGEKSGYKDPLIGNSE
jgi:hypothetical protein